jgi:phage gp36-like protein
MALLLLSNVQMAARHACVVARYRLSKAHVTYLAHDGMSTRTHRKVGCHNTQTAMQRASTGVKQRSDVAFIKAFTLVPLPPAAPRTMHGG